MSCYVHILVIKYLIKKKHKTFLNGSLIKAYTFNLLNDTLDKSIKARVIRFKNVLQK